MRTPKVLDELFSKSWVTSRTSMATEGLPLLHVMYESGIPDNRFSRRQLSDHSEAWPLMMNSFWLADLGIIFTPITWNSVN